MRVHGPVAQVGPEAQCVIAKRIICDLETLLAQQPRRIRPADCYDILGDLRGMLNAYDVDSVDCGSCGAQHDVAFRGDCRDDRYRY